MFYGTISFIDNVSKFLWNSALVSSIVWVTQVDLRDWSLITGRGAKKRFTPTKKEGGREF